MGEGGLRRGEVEEEEGKAATARAKRSGRNCRPFMYIPFPGQANPDSFIGSVHRPGKILSLLPSPLGSQEIATSYTLDPGGVTVNLF